MDLSASCVGRKGQIADLGVKLAWKAMSRLC